MTILLRAVMRRGSGRRAPRFRCQDAAGNSYGTTFSGGAVGVVFKLGTTGAETVLHSFTGSDGWGPRAGLVLNSFRDLYGTTYAGGESDAGVVFKVDTTEDIRTQA